MISGAARGLRVRRRPCRRPAQLSLWWLGSLGPGQGPPSGSAVAQHPGATSKNK